MKCLMFSFFWPNEKVFGSERYCNRQKIHLLRLRLMIPVLFSYTPPIGCNAIIKGLKFMIFTFSDKLQLFLTFNSNQNNSFKLLNRPRNGAQSRYACNNKHLKSLIQGVFALVCDVMAGWPPPSNLFKSAHVVGAALYNRFNTQ